MSTIPLITVTTPYGNITAFYNKISSINCSNSIGGQGSYNIQFKYDSVFLDQPIKSLIEIKFNKKTVFMGVLDNIRESHSLAEGGAVQHNVTWSGRGFEGYWQDIDHYYLAARAEMIDLDPEATMLGEGITFSGSIDLLIWAFIRYHFLGYRKEQRTRQLKWGILDLITILNVDNLYNFDDDPLLPEYMMRDITRSGTLWSMIQGISNPPFSECFFNYSNGEANFHFRPAPFWQTDNINPKSQNIIEHKRNFDTDWVQRKDLGKNDNNFYNTYFVFVESMILDNTYAIPFVLTKVDIDGKSYSLPLMEIDKIQRFGTKLLQKRINWITGNTESDIVMNTINERLPLWTLRLFQYYFVADRFYEGTLSLPIENNEEIQPGHYILDESTNRKYYVNSVSHTYQAYGNKPILSLNLSRGIDWDMLPGMYVERLKQLKTIHTAQEMAELDAILEKYESRKKQLNAQNNKADQ